MLLVVLPLLNLFSQGIEGITGEKLEIEVECRKIGTLFSANTIKCNRE